jgi:threonine dehydrogenase-like Zn-dependent dehydrogenase
MLAYRGLLDPDMAVDDTIGALAGTFQYPFQYGYSCVGIVEQSLSDLKAGELVFAFHPHQDAFVTSSAAVVALGSLEPRRATLFPLVETALQISLDAGPLAGEVVVVFGLGVVGALTALLLQRGGARVLAVELQPWRRQMASELGIDAVAPDALRDVLGSGGYPDRVPLAIEATGNPAALSVALGVMAHEGMVLVASWYGTKPVALPLGGDFHRRRLTIRSTQVSTIPAHLSSRWDNARRRATALDLLRALPLDPLTTDVFPFEEASDAYATIDAGADGLMHAALGYS